MPSSAHPAISPEGESLLRLFPPLPAGATLIAPRLALTAAYCVSPPAGIARPQLWCGLWQQYEQPAGTYDVLQAFRVTVHPRYQAATFCSDVALLELNASAVHALPIGGIAQPEQWATWGAGYPLTAAGFGYTRAPE